ncbi:MAG TPA: TonB-dependent receptor [Niabella sp.]|nr:TonB-dependent receptor [Niabella sp.]HQW13344.1 TonB-dependent receptor [Niabella sp.]HQX18616.1 TonB-dependent receptor [Niabella sp.]HQX42268.1 TonB-dependent receptor [Niabella sp.]HRB06513.1 TonB-dependent receptor [Niabella sp.]
MIKQLIVATLLFNTLAGRAQSMPVTDTVPRSDSAFLDIKNIVRDNLPTIIIAEDAIDDGGSSVVSSILTAGRDPFLSAAEFNFNAARFRLRGYETQGNSVYINGVDFSGLDNGFTPFGLWSGLNDVMRFQQDRHGLQANDFAFGTIALNTNVDMRAGTQRAQTQIGYALSNRNYRHRLTFYHGSGFNKNGWAYALSFSGRYANEGYVAGTYYRGLSYYAGIDKKIKGKHLLSLITFGAPTETGRSGGSVQEAMDLVGSNFYNPSWGYQNGKKRNANVLQTFQPVVLLSHDYSISTRSRLYTTIGYTMGDRKSSALDWYNAPDPRPDYYRYLPSYYASDNPVLSQKLTEHIKNNPAALQINWDDLYDANRINIRSIQNANGLSGNTVTGARSSYILSNRVVDQKRLMANTVFNSRLSDKLSLTAGANYQQQINHYYQEAKDLLGGEFWVNINQFAERDFPNDENAVQYDLSNPNRIIKKGDRYGYDYKITLQQLAAWAQLVVVLNHFDFFGAAEIAQTSFYRTGLNRNGLFPNTSYGKALSQQFINPSVKAGITYKLNGRNYFFVNGTYRTNAPYFENAYISQRTRNTVQDNLKSETILSGEAGYKLNAPKIKLGITGYYTRQSDGFDVLSFYHDQFQNFVNYAMSGIDKIFFGGELGAELKLSSTLSFNGAASFGRYYYDSRQKAIVTVDNSAKEVTSQTIYLKNYRIPSSPQNAYSAGFFYRSPKYWYISFTGNYFDNMWLSPNPLRRTVAAIGDVNPEDPLVRESMNEILNQEKFDAQCTLDFFGGWSKLLPRKFYLGSKRTYLIFSLGVNNILNNTNIRSGGYEQLRFDFEEKNVNKFPPKYYYAYGTNFFASIGLRF